MGYATACHRLPADRPADAVRFALGEERDGILHIAYVCERVYLPAGHGELLYDRAHKAWVQRHDNVCLQRMAECYLEAQMERRAGSSPEA